MYPLQQSFSSFAFIQAYLWGRFLQTAPRRVVSKINVEFDNNFRRRKYDGTTTGWSCICGFSFLCYVSSMRWVLIVVLLFGGFAWRAHYRRHGAGFFQQPRVFHLRNR